MLVKLALFGIMSFVYLIFPPILGLSGRFNKGVILENTVAPAHRQEATILALAKQFRQRLWWLAGLFIFLTLGIFLPLPESLMMTWFILILLTSIVSFQACQIIYIRKMHHLVSKNNWQPPVDQRIIVDTKLVVTKNRKLLTFWWFGPAFLLTIAASLFFTTKMGLPTSLLLNSSSFLIQLLFFGSWLIIKKLPIKALTEDSQINQKINDTTKFYWSLLLIISSYAMVLLLFSPLAAANTTGRTSQFFMIVFVMALIGVMVLSISLLLVARKQQDALINQSPTYRYSGDDQYWRWGTYINPQDPRLMIPDRIGMNISVNLGKRWVQVVMAIFALGIIGVFVAVLIPIYFYDFTSDPFKITANQQQVVITAPFTKTSTIPTQTITDVSELGSVQEITGKVSRTNGYGGENYQIGLFTVNGKPAYFYLDTQEKPVLKIETAKTDYYFTSKKSAETQAAFQEIKSFIK